MTPPKFPSFGLTRRHLIGGALASGATTFSGLSWAAANAQTDAYSSFMALSQYLTERDDLSVKLAKRLQSALLEQDSTFNTQAQALWQWVDSQRVPLKQLNARLKAEHPEWAAVPGKVMQAWYLGIVGDGLKAKAVTYEFALNAQTVSDKLRPPSYSYGVYGSWARNPNTFNLQRIAMPA